MILYMDTSALVKRYFRESHSEEVQSRWSSATHIATSCVAYAETLAALYRKKKEAGMEDALARKIADSFRLDWESLIRVEVNDRLNGYIDRVVEGHVLRGFDAVHLASALVVHGRLPESFLFACFDEPLARAARSEGLDTFP